MSMIDWWRGPRKKKKKISFNMNLKKKLRLEKKILILK